MDKDCPDDAELLSSEDGVLYTNLNGNIGFKREYADFTGYQFEFDYQLPKEKWVNLAITCNGGNTYLLVDGKETYVAINKHKNIMMDTTKIKENDSTTFVAGLNRVGYKFKGSIDNFVVLNDFKTTALLEDAYSGSVVFNQNRNLAFNKKAEANQVEINTSFFAHYVTDGLKPSSADVHDPLDPNYMYRWSSSNIETKGPAELIIDLKEKEEFDQVDIYWQKANGSVYNIQVSDTGKDETWKTVALVNDENKAQGPILDSFVFDEMASGRYVKIYITKAQKGSEWNNVGIFEVEVFNNSISEDKYLRNENQKLFEEAEQLLNDTPEGWVLNNAYSELKDIYQEILDLVNKKDNFSLSKNWSLFEHRVNIFKENIQEVDKSKLQTSVDNANELKETKYTPNSWTALTTIIDEAQRILDKREATQIEVNDVLQALELGKTNLLERANKKDLQTFVDGLVGLKEADYTKESWKNLQRVLTEANKVLDNLNVTQTEVDKALQALNQGKSDLVDLSKLQAKVNEVKTTVEDEYTPNSYKPFKEALEAANTVLANASATKDEVANAYSDLDNTYKALEKRANKSGLKTKIDEMKAIDETLYTPNSYAKLNDVLTDAEALYVNDNATEVDVNTMIVSLAKTQAELVKRANKKDLQASIDGVAGLKETDYTNDSWKNLQTVLTDANKILDNLNATEAEVNDVVKQLKDAISSLEKEEVKLDYSQLEKEVNESQELKEVDLSLIHI